MNNKVKFEQWRKKASDAWAGIGAGGRFATMIALAVAIGFLLGRCTAS